jgi:hypothetical protein
MGEVERQSRGELGEPHGDLDSFARWCAELGEAAMTITPGDVPENQEGAPLFVATNDRAYVVMDCSGLLNDHDAANNLAYELMPKMLRELDAERYGWFSEGWTVDTDDPEEPERFMAWRDAQPADANGPRNYDRRVEIASLVCGERDSLGMIVGTARIDRAAGKLREWEWDKVPWDVRNEGEGLSGRFVDAPMAFLTRRVRLTESEMVKLVKDVAAVPNAQKAMMELMARAALEAGYTPEKLAAMLDAGEGSVYEEEWGRLLERAVELGAEDPEHEKMFQALFEEHSPVSLRKDDEAGGKE